MERFDTIIVGGGMSGLAAAYTLANAGLEVLVLERGDYAGAKNVTGGRLYLNPVRALFPDLWVKAPLERGIAKEKITLLAGEGSLTISYTEQPSEEEAYQSYSILRSKFDRWLAKQAENKGAVLVSKSRVDDLIIEESRVRGVRVGDDELGADVTILADGVLSLLAEKANLRRPFKPQDFAVGIKEVIEIDPTRLEERFGIRGNEGAARLFLGEVTCGKFGGGFLYTNKESISLGIVVGISALMNSDPLIEAPVLLEKFKERSEIARLIQDGKTVEYSAHVIPERRGGSQNRIYGDGILVVGDAAGLALNLGITVRGMDYALASGYYAAQAVLDAKNREDYRAISLKRYEEMLKNSFILKDFAAFGQVPDFLENPRLYKHYPELFWNICKDLYTVPAGPKNRFFKTIRQRLNWSELRSMACDAWKVMKI